MAKIELQTPVKTISGKIGGQVFSTNRSGPYLKTKVTPFNQKTIYQGNQRKCFKECLTEWSGLTDAQRQSWNKFAKDHYGKLTGQNVFVKFGTLYKNLNKTKLRYAPTFLNTPFFYFTGGEYTISTDNIVFTPSTTITVDIYLYTLFTNPLSHGTSYYKSKFKFLRYSYERVGVPRYYQTIIGAYKERFGVDIKVGDNIYCKCQSYAFNGQLLNSNEFRIKIKA